MCYKSIHFNSRTSKIDKQNRNSSPPNQLLSWCLVLLSCRPSFRSVRPCLRDTISSTKPLNPHPLAIASPRIAPSLVVDDPPSSSPSQPACPDGSSWAGYIRACCTAPDLRGGIPLPIRRSGCCNKRELFPCLDPPKHPFKLGRGNRQEEHFNNCSSANMRDVTLKQTYSKG